LRRVVKRFLVPAARAESHAEAAGKLWMEKLWTPVQGIQCFYFVSLAKILTRYVGWWGGIRTK